MISFRLQVTLTALLLLVVSTTAWADTIRVPKDFATIGEALEAAQPTDKIVVSRGVYRESVTVSVDDVEIIGKGAVWDGYIDGAFRTCLDISGDGNTIRGFTFRNCNRGVVAKGNDLLISRCTVRNVISAGISTEGLFTQGRNGGFNHTVERCRIRGSRGTGISVDGDSSRASRNDVRQCSGRGIVVQAIQFTLDRNSVRNVSSTAIQVNGRDITVERNTIRNGRTQGLLVEGSELRVLRNRVTNVAVAGVLANQLSDSEVAENRVAGVNGHGLFLNGEGVIIRDNRSTDAFGGDGIRMVETVSRSGTVISGNRISDAADTGVRVVATGADINGNTVAQTGFGCDQGFAINGSGNDVTDNSAIDVHGVGFAVDGAGNVLSGNLARNCTSDGFLMLFGAGSRLIRCSATGCGTQGLANFAEDLTVLDSVFLRNGFDVGTELPFTTFEGNRFGTGGPESRIEYESCIDL